MVDQPGRTLDDLVRHVGKYPEDAFIFLREGLSFAADQLHGPETEAHRFLQHYLAQEGLDWGDLIGMYHRGELSEALSEAVDAAGGCDSLNRHVGGRELCWSLRDYALQRWGILAPVVLDSWHIDSTADFGRIVFGFIDFDMMRKQDEDTMADFEGVFSFKEGFDKPFKSDLIDDNGDNDAS